MAYNFESKKVYTFSLYPSYVFDTDFKNITALGVVDYEIASKYADLYPLHAQVYSSLPNGTPNDPKAYDYLLLKTTAGNIMAIGIPWIKESTIVLIESRVIQVIIDGVSASDVQSIRNALVQNGYNQIDISLLN